MKIKTRFSQYHPVVLLFYFLFQLLITMFVQSPVLILISLAGVLSFSLVSADTKFKKNDFLFLLVLFIIISATNPLFSHNGTTVLFYIGDTSYTLESLMYGVTVSLKIVCVIIWFSRINETMTDDKIQFLFGRVAPKITMMITMSLRFIPLYRIQYKRISEAQKALGVSTDNKGLCAKIKNACNVFLSLVTWSLENSVETGLSMKARGYESCGRTSYSIYKIKPYDVLTFITCIILYGVTVALIFSGKTEFVFYPTFSTINTEWLSMISYISFFIASFLPLITEITENIKWKYYKSKI